MALIDNILDTNVLIIANGDRSPQSAPECQRDCLKLLMSIMAGDRHIVIDGGKSPNGSEILAEYRQNLHEAGGGFGEMFLRWLLANWNNELHVLRVPITPQDGSYEEFPEDSRLKKFDKGDHKWVATAIAHLRYNEAVAPIMQAADFKWREYIEAFQDHRVEVIFLCDSK